MHQDTASSSAYPEPDIAVRIERAKQDPDSSSVGKLLEKYRSYLRLIAQIQINDRLQKRFDASDVVQETFLDAHCGFRQFRGNTEAELMSWLSTILRRNILDEAKRHGADRRDIRREKSLDEAMDRSSIQLVRALGRNVSSPSFQASKDEQALLIADAIAELPSSDQHVILMRQVHRVSFAEIGGQLDKSEGAVRMIWLRALEKLKRRLS